MESYLPILKVTDKLLFFWWGVVGERCEGGGGESGGGGGDFRCWWQSGPSQLVCQVHFPASSSKESKKKKSSFYKENLFLGFFLLKFQWPWIFLTGKKRLASKLVQIINALCKRSALSTFFIHRQQTSAAVYMCLAYLCLRKVGRTERLLKRNVVVCTRLRVCSGCFFVFSVSKFSTWKMQFFFRHIHKFMHIYFNTQ